MGCRLQAIRRTLNPYPTAIVTRCTYVPDPKSCITKVVRFTPVRLVYTSTIYVTTLSHLSRSCHVLYMTVETFLTIRSTCIICRTETTLAMMSSFQLKLHHHHHHHQDTIFFLFLERERERDRHRHIRSWKIGFFALTGGRGATYLHASLYLEAWHAYLPRAGITCVPVNPNNTWKGFFSLGRRPGPVRPGPARVEPLLWGEKGLRRRRRNECGIPLHRCMCGSVLHGVLCCTPLSLYVYIFPFDWTFPTAFNERILTDRMYKIFSLNRYSLIFILHYTWRNRCMILHNGRFDRCIHACMNSLDNDMRDARFDR